MSINDIFWIFIMLSALQPVVRQQLMNAMRTRKIARLEAKRGSRVILLVHRQETMRLLGFPLMRYIDINDSEDVLRAIQMTDDDVPLDIVLHTPGGLVLASLQMAWQVTTMDTNDAKNCLRRFRSNRDVGLVIFLGLAADMILSRMAGLS